MLIQSVSVRDFGVLEGPLTAEFGPGISLVHGPNESGKTTLMHAIWCALTVRCQTIGQTLERICPRAGGIPEVTVVFSADGLTFTIEKRFAKQRGSARLLIQHHDGRLDELEGGSAEARLREALGLASASGEHQPGEDSVGIWPLIWVRQDRAQLRPTDELTRSGRALLSGRLVNSTDELLAGTGAEALFAGAYDEYSRFFGATGQPLQSADAPLHRVRVQLQAAEGHLSQLHEQDLRHQERVARHLALQTSIAALEEQLPKVRRIHQNAAERVVRVREVRALLQAAEAVLEAGRARCDQHDLILLRRKTLRLRLQSLERALASLVGRLQEVELERTSGDAERQALAQSFAAESENAKARVRDRRRLQGHRSVLDLQVHNAASTGRLEDALGCETKLKQLRRELGAVAVTWEDWLRLDGLVAAQQQAEQTLNAASAATQLSSLSDTVLEIELNGQRLNLGAGATLEDLADSITTITIPRRLSLRVIPGGAGSADSKTELQRCQLALSAALVSLRVDDLAAAETLALQSRSLDGAIARERRRLATLAPNGTAILHEELGATQNRLQAATVQLATLTEPHDAVLESDVERIRAQIRDAELDSDRARDSRDKAQRTLAGHDAGRERLFGATTVLKSQLEGVEARRDLLLRQQREHLDTYGVDDGLAEASVRLVRAREESEAALKQRTDALEILTPESAGSDLDEAQIELDRLARKLTELRDEHNFLSGQLTAADVSGLHEKIGNAESRVMELRETLSRFETRAQAAELLYRTLRECRDDVRDVYAAPLRRALEPLTQRLFPQAEVHFDQYFRLTQLSRSTQGVDEFGQLSRGAREQLGVLVRLGFAKVLAADGILPVILDDPFVGTDQTRFSRMMNALELVSPSLQVIILTCHPEQYQTAGMISRYIDLSAISTGSQTESTAVESAEQSGEDTGLVGAPR